MHIQESGEMYLETIHVLSKKNGSVRAIDISEYMGYSKPSVSRAMSILKGADYIEVDEHGYITLTDTGLEIANKMYERHTLLTEFLIRIGVDKDTAADDACKIEHHISEASFEAIKRFAESENRK
ncbi:MAG: metal-dependent transcriptional regulator [Clostridia bacterium]|nr:metal-dependent transcriptional regulator [Clostridia bacterium]